MNALKGGLTQRSSATTATLATMQNNSIPKIPNASRRKNDFFCATPVKISRA